ncbi:hypothetical protein [Almyronema epifaneia]|uniref:Uncharacterized protein n=1 Tax=Almyronema epifaneia S1 TaxID=2991925 RepID=A0ABW6IEX3_9CYAN
MKNAIAAKNFCQLQRCVLGLGLAAVGIAYPARAQSLSPIVPPSGESIPPEVINGLFSPTRAERFFETGYEQIETDARRLLREPPSEPLLTVEPELLQPPTEQLLDQPHLDSETR